MRKLVQLIVCLVFLCYFIQASPHMPRNGNDDDIIIIKKHKTVRTMRRHRENRPKLEQFDMNNDYDDMRSFRQRKMVPRFFNLGNIQSYLGFPRNRFAREVIGLPEGLIADEGNILLAQRFHITVLP